MQAPTPNFKSYAEFEQSLSRPYAFSVCYTCTERRGDKFLIQVSHLYYDTGERLLAKLVLESDVEDYAVRGRNAREDGEICFRKHEREYKK